MAAAIPGFFYRANKIIAMLLSLVLPAGAADSGATTPARKRVAQKTRHQKTPLVTPVSQNWWSFW